MPIYFLNHSRATTVYFFSRFTIIFKTWVSLLELCSEQAAYPSSACKLSALHADSCVDRLSPFLIFEQTQTRTRPDPSFLWVKISIYWIHNASTSQNQPKKWGFSQIEKSLTHFINHPNHLLLIWFVNFFYLAPCFLFNVHCTTNLFLVSQFVFL